MTYTSEQKRVIEHDGAHAIVAAVAGSGKTHTMVGRIAYQLANGVSPKRILVLMFNKSAQEDFAGRLAGQCAGKGLKPAEVLTFHAFGLRLANRMVEQGLLEPAQLQTEGYALRKMARAVLEKVNAESSEDDQLDLSFEVVTEFLDTIDILKGELYPTDDRRWEYTVTNTDERFVRGFHFFECMRREMQMRTFADMIYDPVMAALDNPQIERFISGRYDHVIVDEFQDVNEAQMTLLRMLAGQRAAVMAVGDEDQCLPPETMITMSDGSLLPVESIRQDDQILSAIGNGRFAIRRVTKVRQHFHDGELIRIRTSSGRELLSTPDHVHFAGYKPGVSHQRNLMYLMFKKGIGYRLGVTRVYSGRTQKKKVMTFQERCRQERADGIWVIRTFDDENEARIAEITESLRYQIPTVPFVARTGLSTNGFVHDQSAIDRIFRESNCWAGGSKLLADMRMSPNCPHYQPRSRNSSRRNLVITLCADPRGQSVGHRISFIGNSNEDQQLLKSKGLPVRGAKSKSSSWRLEKGFSDFGELLRLVDQIRNIFPDINVVKQARLGKQPDDGLTRNSLPFCPASHVRPGMAMFAEDGFYDTVESVEAVPYSGMVYDLDVSGTHNFLANGLVTHNCIYAWRGAKPDYMTRLFQKEFPNCTRYALSRTFRYGHKLSLAANFVISRNKNRTEKLCISGTRTDTALDVRLVRSSVGDEVLKIVREWREGGRQYSDAAILVREYAHTTSTEIALLQNKVPYRLVGASPFFDRAEVLGLRAYLQLAAGGLQFVETPQRRIRLVSALLTTPTLYLRKDAISTLSEAIAESPDLLCETAEAWFKADSRSLPFSRERRLKAVETWRWVINVGPKLRAADFLSEVMSRTNLRKDIEKNVPDPREAAEKLRMLDQIVVLARERRESPAAFAAFLDRLTAEYSDSAADSDRVLITSCHRAKGLEWSMVILPELADGSFPVLRTGWTEQDLEDERRLFYVAATRAIERLVLLAPMDPRLLSASNKGVATAPDAPIASRFLYEANLAVAMEGLEKARQIKPDSRCATIIDRYRGAIASAEIAG